MVKLLAQCLITMWTIEGKLLQGTVSRVILEISQKSGPEDNLQIRSSREQGAL